MKRGETIILAAGDFPKKGGAAWRLLTAAKRVVCCDSADLIVESYTGSYENIMGLPVEPLKDWGIV